MNNITNDTASKTPTTPQVLSCTEAFKAIRGIDDLGWWITPEGFTPEAWKQLVQDLRYVQNTLALEALAVGWTREELFGIHPQKLLNCPECLGVFTGLKGWVVDYITPEEIGLVSMDEKEVRRIPRRKMPRETKLVWELINDE